MTTHKAKIIHRIKIIKGHLSAIENMITSGAYCIDIVHQSLAVQKALKNLDKVIMEEHITHCVAEQARAGNTKKITEELLSIYNYK